MYQDIGIHKEFVRDTIYIYEIAPPLLFNC